MKSKHEAWIVGIGFILIFAGTVMQDFGWRWTLYGLGLGFFVVGMWSTVFERRKR